ncbi:hypothetical protein [Streptomyces spinosirectus]
MLSDNVSRIVDDRVNDPGTVVATAARRARDRARATAPLGEPREAVIVAADRPARGADAWPAMSPERSTRS